MATDVRATMRGKSEVQKEHLEALKDYFFAHPMLDLVELSRLSKEIVGVNVPHNALSDYQKNGDENWTVAREASLGRILCPHCETDITDNIKISVGEAAFQVQEVTRYLFESIQRAHESKSRVDPSQIKMWLDLLKQSGADLQGSSAQTTFDEMIDTVNEVMRQ